MTAFLSTMERTGGQVLDDTIWTAGALFLFDKVLKDQIVNPDDGDLVHLAKQTAVVVGVNEIVHYARQADILPVIFGPK